MSACTHLCAHTHTKRERGEREKNNITPKAITTTKMGPQKSRSLTPGHLESQEKLQRADRIGADRSYE